jgi:predicted nucleic acid-binding protein
MAFLYLDASALVKYYISERGSLWVAEQLASSEWSDAQQRATTIHLSNVEVVCAFERAYRSGRIDVAGLSSVRGRFLQDVRQRYRVLEADLDTVQSAVRLAQRYPLRAYDAVHLAAALAVARPTAAAGLPALVFVSADADLLAAARAEGLATENPNDHHRD